MNNKKKTIEDVQTVLLGKLDNHPDHISEKGCNTCSKEYPLEFKDLASYREFRISGICQKCQDEVFTEVVNELDPRISAQIEKDFYVDKKEIN